MSDLRPVLTDAQSRLFSRDRVLSLGTLDGQTHEASWTPEVIKRPFDAADYIVSPQPESQTRFQTIQRAISRAMEDAKLKGCSNRIYIEVKPGSYEGLVYVPDFRVNGRSVAITLFGSSPQNTVITANIDAEMTGTEFDRRFNQFVAPECQALFKSIVHQAKISTQNACVMRVENPGFQAAGLTIRNSYNADRSGGTDSAPFQQSTGQHQAVALMVNGADKTQFEDVKLVSFQDTLYLKSPNVLTSRTYFRDCSIVGDVDFIFGSATAYFEHCKIISRGCRTPHSWVCAPSTNVRTPFGFVFSDCDFDHDDSTYARAGTFSLGRQWFTGVKLSPYRTPSDLTCRLGQWSLFDEGKVGTISQATLEAVGKCAILNSRIGRHINPVAPWDEWNGGRFSRDGCYKPSDWSPRFRPVQRHFQDMIDHLGSWRDGAYLSDIALSDPAHIFLAEYNNAPSEGR